MKDAATAANEVYRLPPPLFDARCRACWFVGRLGALVVLSFWSLDLQWAQFFSADACARMGRFLGELLPPDHRGRLPRAKLLPAALETLAMSVVGTLLAAVPACCWRCRRPAARGRRPAGAGRAGCCSTGCAAYRNWCGPRCCWWRPAWGRSPARWRWRSHTTGVLGRLFAEAIENAPPGPGFALRVRGVGEGRVFLYATLPQVLPQLVSYTLYRWENNIRAAAVLGVVGAGGLGQMLAFHLGLFQMAETGSVLAAMLVLVLVVDALSSAARRLMAR